MMRAAAPVALPPQDVLERRTSGVRFPVAPRSLTLVDGRQVELCEIGYRGLRIVSAELIAPGTELRIPSTVTAAGHLVATVCWSRPSDDGRVAIGLSLQPGPDTVVALLELLRGVPAVVRGKGTPPAAARAVLPVSVSGVDVARDVHGDEQPHAA